MGISSDGIPRPRRLSVILALFLARIFLRRYYTGAPGEIEFYIAAATREMIHIYIRA